MRRHYGYEEMNKVLNAKGYRELNITEQKILASQAKLDKERVKLDADIIQFIKDNQFDEDIVYVCLGMEVK